MRNQLGNTPENQPGTHQGTNQGTNWGKNQRISRGINWGTHRGLLPHSSSRSRSAPIPPIPPIPPARLPGPALLPRPAVPQPLPGLIREQRSGAAGSGSGSADGDGGIAAGSGCASLQPPHPGNWGKQEINPCRAPLLLSSVSNSSTKPRQSPPAPAQHHPSGWALFPATDSTAGTWRFLQPQIPQLDTPCPTRAGTVGNELVMLQVLSQHSPGS